MEKNKFNTGRVYQPSLEPTFCERVKHFAIGSALLGMAGFIPFGVSKIVKDSREYNETIGSYNGTYIDRVESGDTYDGYALEDKAMHPELKRIDYRDISLLYSDLNPNMPAGRIYGKVNRPNWNFNKE
jgi:hypothetical protein